MTNQQARNNIIDVLSGFPPDRREEECMSHLMHGYESFVCMFGETFSSYPNIVRNNIRWFCIGAGLI